MRHIQTLLIVLMGATAALLAAAALYSDAMGKPDTLTLALFAKSILSAAVAVLVANDPA